MLEAPAAVYRTMQLFLELHLIDRINWDDGSIRYEIGNIYGEDTKTIIII